MSVNAMVMNSALVIGNYPLTWNDYLSLFPTKPVVGCQILTVRDSRYVFILIRCRTLDFIVVDCDNDIS